MSRRTIPEIRERLQVMAAELHELAEETKREFHGRRADDISEPITPQLQRLVRAYCEANPDQAYMEVAKVFGINQGRVSEILFGKRGER